MERRIARAQRPRLSASSKRKKLRNAKLKKKSSEKAASARHRRHKHATSADLLLQVEACLDSLQYEEALDICLQALRLEPNNTQLLETAGSVQLELGANEEAFELFTEAVRLSPDAGHAKYMYLGQMCGGGEESIAYFKKGLEIMEGTLAATKPAEPTLPLTLPPPPPPPPPPPISSGSPSCAPQSSSSASCSREAGRVVGSKVGTATHIVGSTTSTSSSSDDARRGAATGRGGASSSQATIAVTCTADDVCGALCSLAELYLTDCCYLPEAEELCYTYCSRAIEYAPANPEPYQLMASFWISKQNMEEAKSMLLKSLDIWLPRLSGESGSSEQEKGMSLMPTYPLRVSCAKLLLEVSEYDRAHQVLERLVREDDEVMEVWYLLGWLHWLTDELDSAHLYLSHVEKLFHKLDCDDVRLLEHTRELLQQLKDKEEEEAEKETTSAQPSLHNPTGAMAARKQDGRESLGKTSSSSLSCSNGSQQQDSDDEEEREDEDEMESSARESNSDGQEMDDDT